MKWWQQALYSLSYCLACCVLFCAGFALASVLLVLIISNVRGITPKATASETCDDSSICASVGGWPARALESH